MAATMTERYLVVADEHHKDIVIGSYATVDAAREAVEAYNRTAADPFCWIEMSIHDVN
ncbi:MAG: hypothetical protein K1X95_05955 [Acidimicrobiia bacterium]|nr:hypothetical protein [Acidimicrobiia bacterium]